MAAIRFRPFLAAALALAACDSPEPAPPAPTDTASGHCEQRRFEGTAFTICRFDPAVHELELVVDGDGGPLRGFDALERHLGERAGRLLFAVNGGMYDEAGMPIGLYLEDGEERHPINLRDGPGNFHLQPSGVFAVDRNGRVSVTPSRNFRARVRSPRWATQSGPMLVVDGELHPAFQPDGESRLIRNGVGVAGAGNAFFVVSDDPVSFGRFARLFRDGLGCRNALFLDGTVSSLWEPSSGRRDANASLGPMIAVFRR